MTLTVAQMIAMARRIITRSHNQGVDEPVFLCCSCQQKASGDCAGADDIRACRSYEHVRNVPIQPGLDMDHPLSLEAAWPRTGLRTALVACVLAVLAISTCDADAAVRNGRTVRHAKIHVRMRVTGYCPCTLCCGPAARGVTACGKSVYGPVRHFVAAPPSVAFGSQIVIPGYAGGVAVPVLDRGGDITGRRIDAYFPTHRQALAWGVHHVTVAITAKAVHK